MPPSEELMPPSLEITFWVTIIVFALVQIAFAVALRRNAEHVIRVGAFFNRGDLNVMSFIVFWYAIVQSMFFLCRDGANWTIPTAIVIFFAAVIVTLTLFRLHERLVVEAMLGAIKRGPSEPPPSTASEPPPPSESKAVGAGAKRRRTTK